MKLSVIIPIYQAETTLDRCIESIVHQSFSRLEIILVVDGATDHSSEICQYWEKHDGRIVIINKKNGGLSDARNAGLDCATGDYITFVDADDEVEHSTFSQLCDILQSHPEYDILEYPFVRHYATDSAYRNSFSESAYSDLWNGYWKEAKAYTHTYACNKLFRKELLNDIRFDYGRKFEDVSFLAKALSKAKLVATTDKGSYYYYDTPTGITMSALGLDYRDLLEAHCNILEFLTSDDFDEYYSHVLNIQLDVFHHCGEIRLKKRRLKLAALSTTPNKLKAFLLNTIGMRALCKLHSLTSIFRQ